MCCLSGLPDLVRLVVYMLTGTGFRLVGRKLVRRCDLVGGSASVLVSSSGSGIVILISFDILALLTLANV